MVEPIQRQAMYANRRLYCNKWQHLKDRHKWECGTWLSTEERHKPHQAFCKWLMHNCNPCEECNIRVVPMVHMRHHIPHAVYRKPDAATASVIYNMTHRKNLRQCMIAAAREVCNTTRRIGDMSYQIPLQSVQGSARAVRAVRNTRVFRTETRVVADVSSSLFLHHELALLPLRSIAAQNPWSIDLCLCCLNSVFPIMSPPQASFWIVTCSMLPILGLCLCSSHSCL
jgi:hypothetical protein